MMAPLLRRSEMLRTDAAYGLAVLLHAKPRDDQQAGVRQEQDVAQLDGAAASYFASWYSSNFGNAAARPFLTWPQSGTRPSFQ
jgi:hypothetical protein